MVFIAETAFFIESFKQVLNLSASSTNRQWPASSNTSACEPGTVEVMSSAAARLFVGHGGEHRDVELRQHGTFVILDGELGQHGDRRSWWGF